MQPTAEGDSQEMGAETTSLQKPHVPGSATPIIDLPTSSPTRHLVIPISQTGYTEANGVQEELQAQGHKLTRLGGGI